MARWVGRGRDGVAWERDSLYLFSFFMFSFSFCIVYIVYIICICVYKSLCEGKTNKTIKSWSQKKNISSVNQNIILNIIQVIFLNQNDKNGIKTHIILIRVLFDPLMEECRVQALGHLRVKER